MAVQTDNRTDDHIAKLVENSTSPNPDADYDTWSSQFHSLSFEDYTTYLKLEFKQDLAKSPVEEIALRARLDELMSLNAQAMTFYGKPLNQLNHEDAKKLLDKDSNRLSKSENAQMCIIESYPFNILYDNTTTLGGAPGVARRFRSDNLGGNCFVDIRYNGNLNPANSRIIGRTFRAIDFLQDGAGQYPAQNAVGHVWVHFDPDLIRINFSSLQDFANEVRFDF
jgi:hypothetical protein